MKLLITITLMMISFAINAKPVDGKVFYKVPTTGELAERDVVLEVPSRGQGEVLLTGKEFVWKTKKFGSLEMKGKTIFWAIFKTEFQSFKSTILFKGTYLKGSNKLIYSGDFYKKKGHHNIEKLSGAEGFKHEGVFHFDYIR